MTQRATPVRTMGALLRLPLSLLPTFLVPIVFAAQIILFYRLWQIRPGPPDKN